MATSVSSLLPNPLPSSYPDLTKTSIPLFHRTHFGTSSSNPKEFVRGSVCVARFGFKPGLLPEPDMAGCALNDLFGRAESLVYTIADAVMSNSDTVNTSAKQNSDWLSGITNSLESILKVLKDGLSTLHVPYAYGFAIILLTVFVKAVTFPLTKKQVESAIAMRSLQPQIKAMQQRCAGDQERVQLETARLYKLAGINPLAGCLPTLATIPVWIGLYRALSNVADEGLLTEGFFWIPSLAGPTTVAAHQNGSGISWLFPFVDGHPPLGWSDTLAYLVLPLLLVVTQYISVQIMQSSQSTDPNMKSSQAITKFLPLLIGYFSLSVPSGLSLYWLTNNILSTVQQVWLQKFGGARNPIGQLKNDIIKEDQPQFEKSNTELDTPKTKAGQGEKLTSEGLRPGERFKQIKEQEERRRQQREEEKRRAEAAAEGTQIANEGLGQEAKLFDIGNGPSPSGTDFVHERPVTTNCDSSIGVVNGNLYNEDLKKDGKPTPTFGMEKSEGSTTCEGSGTDKQQSYENKQ